MFERFTDRARRAVVLGQEEARSLKHDFIGTEHLLLGLLSEGEGVAAKALEDLGVDLATMRGRIIEVIGRGNATPEAHIPFTPRAKSVMEMALREALQLGHNYIGTEHLLLALLREEKGVAAQVLVQSGVTLADARARVVQRLAGFVAQRGMKTGSGAGTTDEPVSPARISADERFSPALRAALRRAASIARDGDLVGTHHLLAALAVMGDSAASEILSAAGFDPESLPTPMVSWDVTGTGDEDPVQRAARGTVVITDESGMSVRLDDEGLIQRLTEALTSGTVTEEDLRQAIGRTWADLLGDLESERESGDTED